MNTHADLVAERSSLETKRAALANEMNDLVKGKDSFDDNASKRCDAIMVEIEGGEGKPGLHRQIALLDLRLENTPSKEAKLDAVKSEPSAFTRWALKGKDGLGADEIDHHLDGHTFYPAGNPKAVTARPTTLPGGSIDLTTAQMIIDRLKAFGGVREMSYQFDTARGEPMNVPNWDDSDQEGEMIATEGSKTTEEDIDGPGATTFTPRTYSSKSISFSEEYLQDSVVDLEMLIPQRLMRRIGRITNTHGTSGTGASQPQGVVTGANAGITAASASAFTYEELIGVQHAVDPAYRMGMESMSEQDHGLSAEGGMVGWMVNDSFIQAIRKLKDSDGRPLWLANLREGDSPTILGYPYRYNQSLDAIATGKVPALFGNFGYYAFRNVMNVGFYRMDDSAFRLKNSVGFVAFARCDSRYMGAFSSGTTCEAVAKLTMG